MDMPGGGPHRLGPGQITDDSELAMCLMKGILKSRSEDQNVYLNPNYVAEEYQNWMESPPFDIGFTTRSALGAL